MKPNDKAIEAARAEGKRWREGLNRPENQIPRWKVLREADDGYAGYDVIAKFNSHEERDKALERLRAEAMLTAAYAAQFKSEDYAGLIARLRNKGFYRDDWLEPVGVVPIQVSKDMSDDEGVYPQFYNPDGPEAADALEAVLAGRDALKAANNELREENELVGKQMDRFADQIETLENERDALLARLAPVEDEALVEIVAVYCSPEMNWNEMSEKWKNSCRRDARAAIDAIRPHIEAAEKERCAKIAELHSYPMKTVAGTGYNNAAKEIAAAIRSGK